MILKDSKGWCLSFFEMLAQTKLRSRPGAGVRPEIDTTTPYMCTSRKHLRIMPVGQSWAIDSTKIQYNIAT